MVIHELKTEPKYFRQVWDKRKRWELREEVDRFFVEGDELLLREHSYIPLAGYGVGYSGRWIRAAVTNVNRGLPWLNMVRSKPTAVMDIELIEKGESLVEEGANV